MTINFDGVMMTKYFRDDQEVPDDFPWANFAEFEKEMEQVLDYMKSEGVRLGKLEVTPEGYLKGHGHPDGWFDSVDMSKFNNGKP
jgi:hypothetical protein